MTSFGRMQEPARELIPGWLKDTSIIICRKSLTDASAVLYKYCILQRELNEVGAMVSYQD